LTNAGVKKMHSRHVDTTFYRYDPKFGFWGIPDMERDVSFRLRPDVYIRCRHNEEGNRDRPCAPSRLKSPIVCLGGSHTWGVGIEQEDRYTDYLEQMTGRPVLNLGHCSLGLDQICLVILDTAERYKPSAIIVEQYPWAIHRVLYAYVNGYTRPYFILDDGGNLKLQKTPVLARYKVCRRLIGSYYSYRKELWEFQAGINLKDGYDPWTDPIFLFWKIPYYDYMYRLVEKITGVMQDFCRQRGIPLLFGLGAIMQQFGRESASALIDYDLPRKRLQSVLENNRVACVDMTEAMMREHRDEDPVIFKDGHMNAKGHRIFAEQIRIGMEKRGWLN
jgi:hypothetical protein